jgi:hypothetical protein
MFSFLFVGNMTIFIIFSNFMLNFSLTLVFLISKFPNNRRVLNDLPRLTEAKFEAVA